MEKALDRQGRWRSKTVAFRVSPEENNQIEIKVRLSGQTEKSGWLEIREFTKP